jgi:hypothetical protein
MGRKKAFRLDALSSALDLLECMVDDETCSFDHHGSCQDHYGETADGRCANTAARELLDELRPGWSA